MGQDIRDTLGQKDRGGVLSCFKRKKKKRKKLKMRQEL
jgi:hypothetical protein